MKKIPNFARETKNARNLSKEKRKWEFRKKRKISLKENDENFL